MLRVRKAEHIEGQIKEADKSDFSAAYRVLYTKDCNKKRKVFHDGTIQIHCRTSINNITFNLIDENGDLIRKTNEKYSQNKKMEQIIPGEQLEFGGYEIQIEEKINDKIELAIKEESTSADSYIATAPTLTINPIENNIRTANISNLKSRNFIPLRVTQIKTNSSEVNKQPPLSSNLFRNDSKNKIAASASEDSIHKFPTTANYSLGSSKLISCNAIPHSDFYDEAPSTELPPSKSSTASFKVSDFNSKHRGFINREPVSVTRDSLTIDSSLLKSMREHQIVGANFLLDCLFKSQDSSSNELGNQNMHDVKLDGLEDSSMQRGAILADEMGLGKTLTMISVIYACAQHNVCKTAVVCPSSLIDNWLAEFQRWLGFRLSVLVIKPGSDAKAILNTFSISPISKYPVLLISYDLFRRNVELINSCRSLNLLVCDEGHRLKNIDATKTMQALQGSRPEMRVVLTGTPVQNDLEELYALVSFVSPSLLGSLDEYKSMYANFIQGGDIHSDCEKVNFQLPRLLNQIILRRTQADILSHLLPPRHDYVVSCGVTMEQALTYDTIVAEVNRSLHGGLDVTIDEDDLFLADQVDAVEPDATETCSTAKASSSNTTSSGYILPCLLQLRRICIFGSNCNRSLSKQQMKMSIKLEFIDKLLSIMAKERHREKLVVVSEFISVLDCVENLVNMRGFGPCFRLDGKVPIDSRQVAVNSFNSTSLYDNRFVFLLSSRAGGAGINLTGGSRLVMMDVNWNPAIDKQAMSRIWRPGQVKPCFIYRLITAGSIEEAMLQRQIRKEAYTNLLDIEAYKDLGSLAGHDSISLSKEDLPRLLQPRSITMIQLLNALKEKIGNSSMTGPSLIDESIPSKENAEIVVANEHECDLQDPLLQAVVKSLGAQKIECVKCDVSFI